MTAPQLLLTTYYCCEKAVGSGFLVCAECESAGLAMIGRHGLERAEWERRFLEYFRARLHWSDAELAGVIPGELSSWPADEDDWTTETPEGAAAENLSCWGE